MFYVYMLVCSFLLSSCVPLEVTEEKSVTVQPKISEEEQPDKLFIDNFNTGIKPNMLGGDFGAWDKDPNDKTQFCKEVFDPKVKVSTEGFSIKLTYDVDSPNPAYNGFWMKLKNVDFRPYKKLCFFVKGNKQIGFTDKFKIELKNTKGEVGQAIVMDITAKWQEKVIPFTNFCGISDFSEMTEFVIVFEDNMSDPKVGIIYMDDIYVTK